jgi:SHS2 domain-containing protein
MNKYYIPLFKFSGIDELYFKFSGSAFSIENVKFETDLSKAMALSEIDRLQINGTEWAIVVDGDYYKACQDKPLVDLIQNDVNLLIITFRLLGLGAWPSIRFLISDDVEVEPIVFYDTMQINRFEELSYEVYTRPKLEKVDDAYRILANAYSERKYARAHNAIYFAYLATHTIHWIQAFVFWMSALEALFSKDARGGATRTIKTRVNAYIADPNICNESDIEEVYDIRSRIVHGDICASDKLPDENLLNLWKIEKIARACLSKLIEKNDFRHYSKANDRNSFVEKLD